MKGYWIVTNSEYHDPAAFELYAKQPRSLQKTMGNFWSEADNKPIRKCKT